MISFVRVDDRMIHGQTVTRWSLEYPCTGLIAVNDAAAKNPVLKGAYKSAASDKKTFVWAVDEFIAKAPKVLESKDKYFLITKNPIDMKKILVDAGIVPSDVKTVIIGPCNDRPGATKLGNNQSITQEEADALEAITKAGYEVEFALLKETAKRPRSATGRSSEASSVTQTDRICKIDTRKGERNVHKFISGNYSRIIRFPLQYAWSGRNIHR